MSSSAFRIKILLILSSQDEFKNKVHCLMELIEKKDDKILKETAAEVILTVLKMCSCDLIDAFSQAGYFSKELLTLEGLKKVR